ncbi:MAG TPA: hypothetical protein VFB43_00460 [Terracidiphilus sp.]|nr:hypothetical protein [Terracidiphilus sp.]
MNNPLSNYALSSFDARQRLVVSYLYPLPIGKGQLLLHGLNSAADAVIGGWGFNGITTFQEGFPLGLTVTPNNLATYTFQGSQRPNVVPGCGKKFGGSIYNRLGGAGSTSAYFNTSYFVVPPLFTSGNESRTDNQLRQPGVANWDLAMYKSVPIHERISFEFRVEAFNAFNRVQFGSPVQTLGRATFGYINAVQQPETFPDTWTGSRSSCEVSRTCRPFGRQAFAPARSRLTWRVTCRGGSFQAN